MASHAVRRHRAVPLWLLALGLWLGGSTGVLALGGEKSCGGSPGSQACGAQTDQEGPALLQLRTAQGTAQGGPPGATPRPVLTSEGCPGSPGIFCQGNECCPGIDRTGNLTFPCPSAKPCFNRCDIKPHRSKFSGKFVTATAMTKFPVGTAKAMAEFARASYCGPDSDLKSWTCKACKEMGFHIVPKTMTFISLPDVLPHEIIGHSLFVFLARIEVDGAKKADADVDCIISFRGSHNLANWWRNFDLYQTPYNKNRGSCPGCQVETGFYKIWNAVKGHVVKNLTNMGCLPNSSTNDLYITGHSMGAAVGVIGMFELEDLGYRVNRSVLFESPLPGNQEFANALGKRFNGSRTPWRITHAMDPVVRLPPYWAGRLFGKYTPFGTEVYFERGAGPEEGKVCTGLWDESCSLFYNWRLDSLLEFQADHEDTPLLNGANICNPPPDVCFPNKKKKKSAIPCLTVHAYGSAP